MPSTAHGKQPPARTPNASRATRASSPARRARSSHRLMVVANRLPVHRVGSGGSAHWESSAGGLVTGLTLSLLASDNADKAQRIRESLGGVLCRMPEEDACRELSDAASAHDRQARWATVSYALGAVAGVSTLVYALIAATADSGHASSPPASGVASGFGVGIGEGGAELILQGSF